MKTPSGVLAAVARRVQSSWAATLVDEALSTEQRDPDSQERPPAWPHGFSIGRPSARDAEGDWPLVQRACLDWRDWAQSQQVTLREEPRRVLGTTQRLPTHLQVTSLDEAARLCGTPWPATLSRGRSRTASLLEQFPRLIEDRAALTSALTRIVSYTDHDFGLLCTVSSWFATHDATGLTPRQVPVPGVHAKWLDTHQGLVRLLADKESLGLLPRHPARIHFTYLDPDHRAAGGRTHDSATVGDRLVLPYRPRLVIICENKDTALHFPMVPGGVSVEGEGRGAAAIASMGWVVEAERVVYWGDMDADGMEILNEFRACGLAVTSLLMDMDAYETYERFGTDHDQHGAALKTRTPRRVHHLTADEARLYEGLCSEGWARHRRIEQERVPLGEAAVALGELVR